MKTKEQIEELAEFQFPSAITKEGCKFGFIKGYQKCQEDMSDKKYTEEDMLKCWNYLMVKMTFKNPVFFKDYINSLNKQD